MPAHSMPTAEFEENKMRAEKMDLFRHLGDSPTSKKEKPRPQHPTNLQGLSHSVRIPAYEFQ